MRLVQRSCLAWGVPAFVACSGGAGERYLPDLSSVEGVEVARLKGMPRSFDPRFQWTLSVRRRIEGSDPTRPLAFDPVSALPLPSGDLLVYDPAAPSPLAIVDPASDRAVRFARSGQGPGEIAGRVSLRQVADGSFEVLDGGNRQLHHYGAHGAWLGSTPVEVAGWPIDAAPSPAGDGFLIQLLTGQGADWRNELVRVAEGSGALAPFTQLPKPSANAEPGRLQRGRALWSPVGQSVVAMWSDRPSVYVYDEEGTLVREIRLPLSRRSLTEADVSRQRARFGALAANLRPGPAALTNMLYPVSDTIFGMFTNHLWRAAEDPEIPEDVIYWRLLTLGGEYLGFVQQPEDFRFLGPGAGTLWARVLDERLEPMLVELVLERPPA